MQDNNDPITEREGGKITFQELKNELFKCLEGRSERKIASLIFKQYRIDSIERTASAKTAHSHSFTVNYSNKNTKEKYVWTFI
jgi:hypothetical protein